MGGKVIAPRRRAVVVVVAAALAIVAALPFGAKAQEELVPSDWTKIRVG